MTTMQNTLHSAQNTVDAQLILAICLTLCWAANTRLHRLGGLCTTKIYFSQFWRLEVQDQGARMVEFWWRPSPRLQTTDRRLVPASSHGERAKGLSRVSLIRTTISFTRALLTWPNHPPKASPPNSITLGIRISTYKFWGMQTFRP